jgi:GT2 family glycosyltransferase
MDDRTAVIILNYNTWKLTEETVRNLTENNIVRLKDIIVVDNCSMNGAIEKLDSFRQAYGDFTLLKASENNGYACGNNLGLRYAYEHGYRYGLVLNNDVLIRRNDIINVMLAVFEDNNMIACVSPRVFKPNGEECNLELYRQTIFHLTIGALSYRKIGRMITEILGEKATYCMSYRPQGCCMLLDLEKIHQVNYMDEYTFLYFEEHILAERCLQAGYRCACCLDASVIHNHSQTVSKTLKRVKTVRIKLKSGDYYYRHYRQFNWVQRKWCELFIAVRGLLDV